VIERKCGTCYLLPSLDRSHHRRSHHLHARIDGVYLARAESKASAQVYWESQSTICRFSRLTSQYNRNTRLCRTTVRISTEWYGGPRISSKSTAPAFSGHVPTICGRNMCVVPALKSLPSLLLTPLVPGSRFLRNKQRNIANLVFLPYPNLSHLASPHYLRKDTHERSATPCLTPLRPTSSSPAPDPSISSSRAD
jgi:hypothetical protein